MNAELERLLFLLAILQLGPQGFGEGDRDPDDIEQEAVALTETIRQRVADRGNYHKTRRGVDAGERVAARLEKRDPNYPEARVAAGLEP